jgi:flagellar FliJ protein
MKFEFSFDRLLQHKKRIEDEARRHFNEAQGKVDKAQEQLNTMYNQVDRTRLRTVELSERGGAAVPELSLLNEFIIGQRTRIENQRAMIRDLAAEAERLQDILVGTARERKTLEKLREKRLEDFKKARKKKEMKEVDELVVTRFKNQAS